MTRNSWTIARNFNVVMDEIGRAIIPKSKALWVYIRFSHKKLTDDECCNYFVYLVLFVIVLGFPY